ncbi:hypothetical protein BN14_09354 [Rhizoctonia solani AG-1 IB]|uniref:Uncharacterized protein n=1 Tax=Thanatephorus cucumeris (strain AG1-IB / isolate 7/3/14) TaxID=1108050 RepID=M5C7F5_THACB|nr:hypothetical protein BN14_09354 [Rhizoctonia solani AG-1 IB]
METKPHLKKPKLTPVESSSSDSSDSDSDSGSSDSDPNIANPAAKLKWVNKPPAPAARNSLLSSSESFDSSDSSDSNDSDDMFPKPLNDSSVQRFFSQFPSFEYNSSQSVMSEYFCMTKSQDFKSLTPSQKKKARENLKNALAKDFGQLYRDDLDDLEAWQTSKDVKK